MIHIVLIIILCLIVYYRSLNHSFIVDDITTYKTYLDNKDKFSFKSRSKLGWRGVLRYVRERLYGSCTLGLNIRHDNIFRVALFSTACVLIYLAFGKNNISFWAAILYALNPINNQISLWANGRRYVLNIILTLLMLTTLPYGILLYPLTLGLQVTAIFAPLLSKVWWHWLLIPVGILAVYPWAKNKIAHRFKIVLDPDRRKFTPKRLMIITKQYGHYFFKIIFPGVCAMTYPTMYYWGITEEGSKEAYAINTDFWRGIGAYLCTLALFCYLPGEYKNYIVFFFLSLIQWCAIIPITQDMADRYASMPTIITMFLISYFVNTHLANIALPILTALAVYYVSYLQVVYKMYRNIWSYWVYHRYHFPALPAPRKYEIDDLIRQGKYMQAWYLTEEGLRLSPNEYCLLVHAAICHRAVGAPGVALDYINKARENYYIGQKDNQEPKLLKFAKEIDPSYGEPPSRQVRRQLERKNK